MFSFLPLLFFATTKVLLYAFLMSAELILQISDTKLI